jgi:hypothetical protein
MRLRLMRRNVWSSLRRIWSGGGVAHLAKAIGNTLHTVGPMSRDFLRGGASEQTQHAFFPDTLVEPVLRSAPYGNPPTCARLIPFSFPFSGSFPELTNSAATAANLCSLATLPPTGRKRTDARTTGSQQVADQFCGYENGTSQLIRQLSISMGQIRATPCDPGN